MYSNMYVNPSNLEKTKDQILVLYDVIVKNVDTKSHDVDVRESFINVGDKKFPMSCSRFAEKDQVFKLESDAQTRLVCLGRIDKNIGGNSDHEAIIEIPLDQDKAKFEYLLRAEDFK